MRLALIVSGLLAAIGVVKALHGGPFTFLWMCFVCPFISCWAIWLTRRKMEQGRTIEEMMDWWGKVPILGAQVKANAASQADRKRNSRPAD